MRHVNRRTTQLHCSLISLWTKNISSIEFGRSRCLVRLHSSLSIKLIRMRYRQNSGPGLRGRYCDYSTGWAVRGSNPGGGEIFPTRPDRALGPTLLPVQWVPGPFPGEYGGRCVAFTTHPHLAPRLKKVYGCTSSTPPLALHGLLYGKLHLFAHKTTRGFEFLLAPLCAVSCSVCRWPSCSRPPVNTKTSAMLQVWPLLSYEHKNADDTEAIFELSSDLWSRRPQK